MGDVGSTLVASPRTVLVTGGASGIGRAVVNEFGRLGDLVTIFDQQQPDDLPDDVPVVVGDVREPADNERAVATVLERHGRLNVFVGNAGIHDGGFGIRDLPAGELADLVRRIIDVDVIGYLLGAQAVAEPLTATRGCMVFTLSDASFVVRGNGAGIGYVAAKHAGLGLVRHLAAELAPLVRVNAVAPGGILTGLKAATAGNGLRDAFGDPEEVSAAVRRLNPLGVMLRAEQVSPLYAFLASPAAAGMTGEVLRPDGGLAVR